jgi:hypothetical protein
MKNFILALALTLATSSLAYADGFDTYLGCYETLKMNGKAIPVNTDSRYFVSRIEKGEALAYSGLDAKPIPSISFRVYQGYSSRDNTHYIDGLTEAFLDRGNFSQKNKRDIYSFQGQVSYRFQPDIIWQLKTSLEVFPISQSEIRLHVIRTIKGNTWTNLDADTTYDLKQVACP